MTVRDRPAPPVEAAPTSRHAEHLAEYSFQFDVEAARPPHPVRRPAEGERWTLAQTLQEVRLRSVDVVEAVGGLRVRHAHRLPALAAAVREHQRAVRLWLRLGAGAPARGWDDETWLRWTWLRSAPPLPHPAALRPGVSVTDWSQFMISVADQIAAGPEAPTAAGLRRDLADLFAAHAVLDVPAPTVWRRARAA
ncbi:hypothetical protein [Rubrivirga litoralis]|uniref:Uncharacterized protein n=1 Tax=Rubrivirga litoralis TaxID=3075598 RepID=A0ABU3BMB0_9BACT|nr:hypothetical protein [Rubrivirga sp. F394]MDT0630423.1 hypothetical protein [Rubrivirga sp. F394]